MTPTLAMVCGREAAIRGFQSEPFYTVQLMPEGFLANGGRMKEKTEAEKVAEDCRLAGTATVTKAECRERTEKPPALYDLTSLQRDANRLLGFTAKQTLDYTQDLYEKKLVTYPGRTAVTSRRIWRGCCRGWWRWCRKSVIFPRTLPPS